MSHALKRLNMLFCIIHFDSVKLKAADGATVSLKMMKRFALEIKISKYTVMGNKKKILKTDKNPPSN